MRGVKHCLSSASAGRDYALFLRAAPLAYLPASVLPSVTCYLLALYFAQRTLACAWRLLPRCCPLSFADGGPGWRKERRWRQAGEISLALCCAALRSTSPSCCDDALVAFFHERAAHITRKILFAQGDGRPQRLAVLGGMLVPSGPTAAAF